jgi:RNA polymerase sigma factor (sigma-70 family)
VEDDPEEDEVTVWLKRLTTGDADAARRIWNRYIRQMLAYARKRLAADDRRVADEEDLAVSAFHSFCHRIERGQFPDLNDRESLWKLLTTIIARKASSKIRRSRSQKRGGGKVRGESAFFRTGPAKRGDGLGNIASGEPTPAFAAEMAEQCARLLDCLPDECRRIVLCKLEGRSNAQIADQLNLAPRTIDRKLAAIRAAWQRETSPAGEG